MGLPSINISFVISEVGLTNALIGNSLDLETIDKQTISVLQLTYEGSMNEHDGLFFHDYSGRFALDGHLRHSQNGVLVSKDGGKTFVGTFKLKEVPDDL